MKAAQFTLFAVVSLVLLSSASYSKPAHVLSDKKHEILQRFLNLLTVVYDNDKSAIPNEPNEILALEASQNPEDRIAWVVFKLMKHIIDPNTIDNSLIPSIATPKDKTVTQSGVNESELLLSSFSPEPYMLNYSTMEMIQEIDNPLGSCVLDPGTYRIQSLPLQIEGHVVLPAGVTLIAPFEPNSIVIEVMPDGLLETGKAAFYTNEDYPDILPPVQLVPEDPNHYFNHNLVGIYVHRGADPKTRLENLEILGCKVGIVIDEQLSYPIRHVITYKCYDGIHVNALTDIVDCQFWFNGSVLDWMLEYILANAAAYVNGTLFDSIRDVTGVGIYVCVDANSFPEPEVLIDRTVVYDGDVGLYIESAIPDPNLPDPNSCIPRVTVQNSAFVSNYFWGIYQSQGLAWFDIRHCAFGNNLFHINVDIPLVNCIGLYRNPFYLMEYSKRLFIDPWSPMTDAGYGLAEDGMGTAHDRPDMGWMDIGSHFPLGITGNFGIPSSPADFNWDGIVDEKDLELMTMCMGATTDPNIVKLDTNYDSRVNMPDFSLFSFDYGYSGDPNESFNNDPNCRRSDFDGDDRVNLTDLALFSEHWLTAVFDEYRLCSLCNFYSDPNDPNSPEVVDENDMAAFMAEWGKTSLTDCVITFENENREIIEPNQLSGFVTLYLNEYPEFSTWIFVQVDGSSAGQIYADSFSLPAFDIPTYEFSNGCHEITIGGYTRDSGCWIKTVSVEFCNPLYFASIPDMYEPNELYEINGFFGEGTFEIATDPNTSTISDTGYIRHSTVISASGIAEVTLNYENGQSSDTQTFGLLASVDLSKKDPNSWRAVIIAPDKKLNKAVEDKDQPDNRLITAIRETLQAANIPYEELLEKNAHWDNLKIALTGPKLNYVYWIGHMNSYVGRLIDKRTDQVLIPGVQRTHFTCWNKRSSRLYEEAHVMSWVKSDRSDVPPYISIPDLPSEWDTRGLSMTSLKLWETKKIKEFWAIGCQSALRWETSDWNDMALAVGAYNYKDVAGHYTHIYIGNKIDVTPGGANNFLLGYPRALSKIIRRHSTTNLKNAMLTNDLTEPELLLLWGPDSDRDGYADNTLQWWPSGIDLDRVIFQ